MSGQANFWRSMCSGEIGHSQGVNFHGSFRGVTFSRMVVFTCMLLAGVAFGGVKFRGLRLICEKHKKIPPCKIPATYVVHSLCETGTFLTCQETSKSIPSPAPPSLVRPGSATVAAAATTRQCTYGVYASATMPSLCTQQTIAHAH